MYESITNILVHCTRTGKPGDAEQGNTIRFTLREMRLLFLSGDEGKKVHPESTRNTGRKRMYRVWKFNGEYTSRKTERHTDIRLPFWSLDSICGSSQSGLPPLGLFPFFSRSFPLFISSAMCTLLLHDQVSSLFPSVLFPLSFSFNVYGYVCVVHCTLTQLDRATVIIHQGQSMIQYGDSGRTYVQERVQETMVASYF